MIQPTAGTFIARPVLAGTATTPVSPTVAPSGARIESITETPLPEQPEADRAARRAEESALLARIVERDELAIEALYSRYSRPLYSLAYQVTGADRFAQDVVQEVFVAVWNNASRFDPAKGAVGPWLFSVARHKAIDLVLREANIRKRTADADMELEAASDDVDREVWHNIRRERVREAIDSLTEPQRVALELAFFGGLTHVEVAETLGIPLGTAKTRIRSALLRLRDVIGTSLSGDEPGGEERSMTEQAWTTEPSAS